MESFRCYTNSSILTLTEAKWAHIHSAGVNASQQGHHSRKP
ncbi:hypothetical protein BDL97_13G100200 [Sphagnum fallax]|nr:hypothetical protein BDL97_13G100200 [Sphagnum fallax]